MKIINTIFSGIFIIVLLLVSSLFLVPLLPIANNIQIKIVESGSMEPTILTGSLVIIKPATSYAVGDIITFTSVSADVPTTHRIVGIREASGQKFFMTKGDANEEADTNETALRSVIGKVALAVPYVGFVLDFARQPIGFGLLIVLPALLIIWSELEKIWRELRKPVPRQTKKITAVSEVIVPLYRADVPTPVMKVRMMEIARPATPQPNKMRVVPVVNTAKFTQASNYVLSSYVLPLVVVFSSLLFVAMSFTGSTVSYFNDIEAGLKNLLQASALDFSLSPKNYSFVMEVATEALIEPVITIEGGEAPVTYDINIEVVSASSTLCDALVVTTTLPLLYTGKLVDLAATSLVFNDAWGLTVTLDPVTVVTPGETCDVNLVYLAHRVGVPVTAGYEDFEKIALQFSTPPETASAKSEALMVGSETVSDFLVPANENNIEPIATSTSPVEEPVTDLQKTASEQTTNTEFEIKPDQKISDPEPEVPAEHQDSKVLMPETLVEQ